ncbi:MAG: family 14 glycosylhydrolase [Bdellovibrio sp.]
MKKILFVTFYLWFSFSSAGVLETANVMAPLQVPDWSVFENQLDTVKSYGVNAVSVDVWWGKVEQNGDNVFDWNYYDTIFSKIKSHGLKIVPIFSFHKCGGNVGDECNIPLPQWLYKKYDNASFQGVQINADDLKYKSEQGNYSEETVQLWADQLVANDYVNFVKAFKNHFTSYENDFLEINVSAGPAGELRYPSYNSHDKGTGYPTRGALQSYSRLAKLDFQNKMIAKYSNLENINKTWNTNLTSLDQVQPPSNGDNFFFSGDYRNTQYGKDFIDWYNGSLVEHGRFLVGLVIENLKGSFASAKIGFKIPGVHWQMANPVAPRTAEIAAGLIQTSIDFKTNSTGHGYAKIISLAKDLEKLGRPVVLHFTCLEMDDQNTENVYSLAKSLVFWVAREAARQHVEIKGENALSGGVSSDWGWNNTENAFTYAAYAGFTALRINDVTSGVGQSRYSSFIRKYRSKK